MPGTPDAVAADKERDAARKRAERAAAPPPLPPAGAVTPVSSPGQPGAGLVSGAVAVPPPLPWQAVDLTSLCAALIDAAEDSSHESLVKAARKALLPDKLIREMEKDFDWPKLSKESIRVALPALMSKWLNRSGISSEHKEELIVCGALLGIITHTRTLKAKIAELAEKSKPAASPAAEARPAVGEAKA